MKKRSEHAQFSAPATTALPRRARGAQAKNANALRHGLHSRRLEQTDGAAALVREWQDDVRAALGGELTPQQDALLEVASRTWLMLSSVDAWLLEQPSLVNRRRRELLPVVRERSSLVRNLRELLGDLGLKREPERTSPLERHLRERYGAPRDDGEGGGPAGA